MVQPAKENVGDFLAVVVRVALDVREQRVEVDEVGCLELTEVGDVVAFGASTSNSASA